MISIRALISLKYNYPSPALSSVFTISYLYFQIFSLPYSTFIPHQFMSHLRFFSSPNIRYLELTTFAQPCSSTFSWTTYHNFNQNKSDSDQEG